MPGICAELGVLVGWDRTKTSSAVPTIWTARNIPPVSWPKGHVTLTENSLCQYLVVGIVHWRRTGGKGGHSRAPVIFIVDSMTEVDTYSFEFAQTHIAMIYGWR